MVQGAKHMKSNNAAANGGSSPQPKPQPKPKRRRKRLPRWADRLITIVIILIGVGLMTWPWILDRLEASGVFNQISTVSSTVDALSAEERERILLQARSYNEQLAGEATELPADQIEPYTQQLIFDRDPMMSWVDIPSIDVSMPIYHGTSEEVLMAGVGHLEGTSLPVGGNLDALRAHRALGHAQPEHVRRHPLAGARRPGAAAHHEQDARLQDGGLRGRAARGDGVADHRARRRQGDARHLHTLRRERPSPAGALRAHQVQQEGRRQAKVAGRPPLGQARVCRAHRGRCHCAVAAGHRGPRGPQTPQGQGLGIRHSPEPPQRGQAPLRWSGLPNHHNIR